MTVRVGPVWRGHREPEDILRLLASELESRSREAEQVDENLIKEARNLAEHGGSQEDVQRSVDSLQQQLQKYAPPFCYFGVKDGETGYWPNWPAIEELPVTSFPEGMPGWCRVVTQDGNTTSIWHDGELEVML